MFSDVESAGKIKIEYTCILQRRLKEWSSKCKRKHEYLTELPKIPYVSRVERLMHTQLMPYHKARRCESCPRPHTEWFEVNGTKAIQVFRKWHHWIVTALYALHARTGKWAVRPELRDNLKQLFEPLEEKHQAKSRTR